MNTLIQQAFPEFTVDVYYRDEIVKLNREEILGHWSVFFFYPADFTFVCPTELGELADHYEKFRKLNCEIYSVSCDTVYVHKAWKTASETIRKICYPMIGDPRADLARKLGVYKEDEGVSYRASFIVNPEGDIVAYEVNSNGIGRSAEELLRKLEAASFVHQHGDQVCPASWKPGEKTLKPSLDLVGLL